MIGKPEWFKRRKYGGWGLFPSTWQGWVYLAVLLVPFAVFQSLPYWGQQTRIIITIAWAAFLLIDAGDIMIRMKRDEREKIHEAIAERNALWIILVVLIAGASYQIIVSGLAQQVQVDWWIVIALFAGVIAKAISNIYLDKKD
jgi:hypothetical protein